MAALMSSLGSMTIDSIEIYRIGSTVVLIVNEVRCEFTPVVRGDVNGDGVCDALDAKFLHHVLYGKKGL